MKRPQTPSQTIGPFFHLRLGAAGQQDLVTESVVSRRIRVQGRVLDGDGAAVGDALVELWQADAGGRYLHPDDRWPPTPGDFTGFGRAATEASTGGYWFETVKPGRVEAPDGRLQAPHLNIIISARGLLGHLFTRIYFGDEAAANAECPVLGRVPEERRATLLARRLDSAPVYERDLVLRGPNETVFFDV